MERIDSILKFKAEVSKRRELLIERVHVARTLPLTPKEWEALYAEGDEVKRLMKELEELGSPIDEQIRLY